MFEKYDPKKIEAKWQEYWEKNQTFVAKEDLKKEKFYALIEFPYPSGAGLHVGHPRPFTAMDVVSRKRRMQRQNVLFPIGFDAFGLPTENYAIKTGRPPVEVTAENIATFTRQLKSLGFGFDWSRVLDTTDPNYYKWTQWIFLQFFKHGLAYKKNMPINWCPKDKIGLANEEVVDGKCERCGTEVEKRDKEQWMLAITKYADSLLEGLKEVDYIPQARAQQENWIGRSEGAEIEFGIKPTQGWSVLGGNKELQITVFTTRPDTIFGVTFVAISAELADTWIKEGIITDKNVKKYIQETLKEQVGGAQEEEKEKTGIDSGIIAINPVSGEEIPVWITNYVMGGVGTGAIMGVPAHDERDFDFAKKYGLEIKEVVAKKFGERHKDAIRRDGVAGVIEKDDKFLILYDKIDQSYRLPAGGYEEGETDLDALKREIQEETGYKNFEIKDYLGEIQSNYFVSDRQVYRYRFQKGYRVELLNEEKSEVVGEDRDKFEYFWLDAKEAFERFASDHADYAEEEFISRVVNPQERCFGGKGIVIHSDFLNELSTKEATEKIIQYLEEKGIGKRKVNYKLRDWVFSRQRYWGEPIPLVNCEKCGGWVPLPEEELPLTLPKVEKYEPTDNGESPLAPMTEWVNTTCPQCGGPAKRETDTMPNWAGSSWYFLRYVDPKNANAIASKEALQYWTPVDWYNGGMEHTVLHLLYSRFWNQFLFDIGVVPIKEPYKKRTSHGMILAEDGQKMSKSRGNVINPDEMVEKYGADALRAYIMFMGPFDQAVAWDTNGLVGVRRFLDRVWNLQEKLGNFENKKIQTLIHQTIKKVSEDIEGMRFNTAIAKMMEFVNEVSKEQVLDIDIYKIFVKLLSPFAPHMTEEIWSALGEQGSIALAEWPEFDAELAKEDTLTIVVQINGKVRDTFDIPAETADEEVKHLAVAREKIQKNLEGKEPKKVIYVKGKLISIVV